VCKKSNSLIGKIEKPEETNITKKPCIFHMEKEKLDFLLTRRSIRKFQDKEVSLDLLKKAVDIARYAPSAHNNQPWEFIIVTNREKLEALSEMYIWAKPLKAAKACIAIVTDPKLSPRTHLIDGANATMYVWLALHAMGLGGVWINALENKEMKKALKIPDDKNLLAILAIGWPAERPKPRPRKSLEEILYFEEYGKK